LDNIAGALNEWDILRSNYPADSFWDEAWEETAYTQWGWNGDYRGAVATLLDFAAASPTHPRTPGFLFDAGRIAERDGELQRAANIWETVAVDYPEAAEAYRALFLAGIAEYRLGGYQKSRETFQRTLGLATSKSEEAAVHLWIGKTESILGDTLAARAAWERAATADPTGYYSERARDLLFGREAFEPPLGYDTAIEWEKERHIAEEWLRMTFSLSNDIDLRGLGALEADRRLQRGTRLWNLGLYSEARVEFESLRQSYFADPVNSYRLANYLSELGLYRSAIFAARRVLTLAGLDDAGTMVAPRYFNYLRFGTYFNELVGPAAQAYGFHPLFIYSVMRQESLFEGFIRSSAGARGLMQIIPTTGQAIHELNGWPPNYTADDLYRPKVSVTFGTDHLGDLRDIFGGNLYATLAGYNAGQGNASIWLEAAGDDLDLYVEIVRFDETRRYIRGIYEIYSIYLRFYDRSF
jgi:soluble lytic murein transglycosylase